jgi:hypothetical protein
MCVIDSILLFYATYYCAMYLIYAYWISCAHMIHLIKSRGRSLSWCAFVFKCKFQIGHVARGAPSRFYMLESCKIVYCHQTPNRGRLKEHFEPFMFLMFDNNALSIDRLIDLFRCWNTPSILLYTCFISGRRSKNCDGIDWRCEEKHSVFTGPDRL